MQLALWALFFILIAIAFLGCFISKFPGPVLALAAILMAKFFMTAGELISWGNIVVITILVIASVVLNRFIPIWSKKLHPYGKGGNWGAIIGSIFTILLAPAITDIEPAGLGITVLLLCFILIPFLFSFLFEFFADKDAMRASRAGGSATLVYVSTTLVKLITVLYAVYLMFVNN